MIEKMSLVNITCDYNELDKLLFKCILTKCFHLENAIHAAEDQHTLKPVDSENIFKDDYNSLLHIMDVLAIKPTQVEFDINTMENKDVSKYIVDLNNQISQLYQQKEELKETVNNQERVIQQIKHLVGLEAKFEDIFACEFVKVRIGRLPAESYKKLAYYDDNPFFFFPFDNDDEYYWGIYFSPTSQIDVIDNTFNSLFFERLRIPDYVKGTPEEAKAIMLKKVEDEKSEIKKIDEQLEKIKKDNLQLINSLYSFLSFNEKISKVKKSVGSVADKCYIVGFIPSAKEEYFKSQLSVIKTAKVSYSPHDSDVSLQAPVKLKNSRFAKPFEMFVDMYSLPSYQDIDPTSIVAYTYTLLFGIMFGDLGQGILLALIGFLISKKMALGKVMVRLGFSSAIFGVLYGSVFGYEHLLDGFYQKVFHLSSKPIHVFDNATTNMLLLGAVAIGILLIATSMIINIYLGFKNKDYQKAIFGNNGIAGFTLYMSTVIGAVSTLLLKKNLFTPLYIICLIVIPLLMIFFREPLTKIMKHRKDIMSEGIGEFIIANFFELFEYVLSYLSNSMSFLRVGGFILSHAGMMAVVMSLSEMANGGASIIIVALGNIFVMCLEGLIVGIQVLRLEFYELFSRFFEGNGKPYQPIQ